LNACKSAVTLSCDKKKVGKKVKFNIAWLKLIRPTVAPAFINPFPDTVGTSFILNK
jgi:hypothetical protein